LAVVVVVLVPPSRSPHRHVPPGPHVLRSSAFFLSSVRGSSVLLSSWSSFLLLAPRIVTSLVATTGEALPVARWGPSVAPTCSCRRGPRSSFSHPPSRRPSWPPQANPFRLPPLVRPS